MQYIENKTFDELNIGDRAELTRTLRNEDVELFAVMSGDVNPAHVDEAFAKTDQFHKVIAHGMWGGALISAVLGTELPGPGTIYLNQSLSFRRPVGLGDTVTVRVTVREKLPEKKRLLLDCECINQSGETVIKGEANVIAPSEKVRRPRALLPEVHLHERGLRYRQLVEEARKSSPIRTAVVYPCDGASLSWALDCASEKLIIPVLVGPEEELRRIADEAYRDLHGIEIVGAASSLAAADRAVALAREGRVDALLRGALPTQELMGAVMKPLIGLRTERRMSHVLALDVPNYSKPLFVTDAAINSHPDLPTKRDIVRNAIELTHALGIAEPKVAILSAIETVVPKLASRIDAAALRKMSEWGQITGALVDGPLAFDTAVSKEAAKLNGITSSVAGDADILVCPDLEAANAVANLLIYLAGADAAGIVLGARVPILLRTHAGDALIRQASAGLAQLVSHHMRGAAAERIPVAAG